jgi:predicted HD phosphohydrolase
MNQVPHPDIIEMDTPQRAAILRYEHSYCMAQWEIAAVLHDIKDLLKPNRITAADIDDAMIVIRNNVLVSECADDVLHTVSHLMKLKFKLT